MAHKGREMRLFLTIVSLGVAILVVAIVGIILTNSLRALEDSRKNAEQQVLEDAGGIAAFSTARLTGGDVTSATANMAKYLDPALLARVFAGDAGPAYDIIVDMIGPLYGVTASIITMDGEVVAASLPEGITAEEFPPAVPPGEDPQYQAQTGALVQLQFIDNLGERKGHFVAWAIGMKMSTLPGKPTAIVQFIFDRTDVIDQINANYSSERGSLITQDLAIGAAVLVASLLIALFGVRYLARKYIMGPIAAVSATAEGIMAGTFHGEVVVDEGSDYAALQSATSDMIERRKAEAELLKTQDYLENLLVTFNTISDIFYVFDTDGKMLRWNRALLDVTGYGEDEIAGMRFVEFFDEPDRANIAAAIAGAQEGGRFVIEAPIATKQGKKVLYEFAAASLQDASGNPVGICGIGRDVTERNDLQQKLLRAERLGVLGEMAGSMGHEMRNPLNVIKTSAFYIRGKITGADPKVMDHLDRVERGVERADNIITDLLSYSRIGTSVPRETDMRLLVDSSVGELTVPEGVEIKVAVPDDLPAGWVDPGQYGQVLHNLLVNAVQAMPAGGTIEVELRDTEGYLETVVRDNGAGISAEDLPKVFEPLFSTKAVGTGFGLAVCRRLVEDHRGTISLESEEGKGTTVMFRLPMKNTSSA